VRFIPLLLGLSLLSFLPAQEEGRVLLADYIHLGNDPCPEWPEANEAPDGTEYAFSFQAKRNGKELCLQLTQRHVDDRWSLRINGAEIAVLVKEKAQSTHYYPVPAKVLKSGANEFSLTCERVGDDITFGDIRLLKTSYRDRMGIRPVQIQVLDSTHGGPLPARITVADAQGNLAPLYYPDASAIPLRKGVAYTDMKGRAQLEIGAGTWTIWASRGTEWGVDSHSLLIEGDGPKSPIVLRISREVDTAGYVAADTHIHTVTGSGHGDASTWERVHTLAGEGVEMAIATDHNHHMDYRPLQKEIGAQNFYTSVIGNEVTTSLGHFNAFPFTNSSETPDHKITPWAELQKEIRSKGAQVVILNHPRWPDFNRGPFGKEAQDLDRATGTFAAGLKRLDVDGIEIFNSTTKVTAWEEVMKDWFSLLNAGDIVYGVGSSDSHTVGDSVGQGRTYVLGNDLHPDKLKVDDLCASFQDGKTSMSMGVFMECLEVREGISGSLEKPLSGNNLTLNFRVAAASWADVNDLVIYVNGKEISRHSIEDTDAPLDVTRTSVLHLKADSWVVAVATGSKPTGTFWQSMIPNIGALTNPIWVDGDGDGKWTPPNLQQ